jgi:hypothetical protein
MSGGAINKDKILALWTDDFAELLREIVPNATPMGAWSAGALTVEWIKIHESTPPREVLLAAAQCENLEQLKGLLHLCRKPKREVKP